ncbi:cupin domain-containing protein [Macrococcus equipercicus]|uniref:Cupin domain-containing protein n=1 Tax=Macrococcus equipercicus TaxID=69967 RepID=A0A9Q9F3T6_9STAP|nr:cupin domain-containing protein [Macrococcus equipercicus]KAA1036941.1 cupin domain-containing protein [Macrococcus equipercicus]UTH14654.1 cupin domain-containing protein [Macrococcus equipercicus]
MAYNYEDQGKKPFAENIEGMTLDNENFRTTIWTGEKLQVTLMTIQPGDDIGLEVHEGIDQFLRIEQGEGLCQMGPSEDNLNFEKEVKADDAIIVPADTWHNVTNKGTEPLKIYSIYAGPDHEPGTVHKTHEDAENDPNE